MPRIVASLHTKVNKDTNLSFTPKVELRIIGLTWHQQHKGSKFQYVD